MFYASLSFSQLNPACLFKKDGGQRCTDYVDIQLPQKQEGPLPKVELRAASCRYLFVFTKVNTLHHKFLKLIHEFPAL